MSSPRVLDSERERERPSSRLHPHPYTACAYPCTPKERLVRCGVKRPLVPCWWVENSELRVSELAAACRQSRQ